MKLSTSNILYSVLARLLINFCLCVLPHCVSSDSECHHFKCILDYSLFTLSVGGFVDKVTM